MADQAQIPPVPGSEPAAVAPARSRPVNMRLILIIAGVVLLACVGLGVAIGGSVFMATQPFATVGDTFMTTLRDSKYAEAYNLCTPALQRQLRSPQDLEQRVKSGNAQVTSWSFTSRSITGNEGKLEGSAQLKNGSTADVRLVLDKSGDVWKISGFTIRER